MKISWDLREQGWGEREKEKNCGVSIVCIDSDNMSKTNKKSSRNSKIILVLIMNATSKKLIKKTLLPVKKTDF